VKSRRRVNSDLGLFVIGVWMKGTSSLVFPGLGLIVATPIVLVLLLVVEIIIVFIAAYLVRLIPIALCCLAK
jgi:hypothetical protein